MRRSIAVAGLLAMLAGGAVTPAPGQEHAPPALNLTILQQRMRAVADSVLAMNALQAGGSIRAEIQPPAIAWYLEQQVIDAARGAGLIYSAAAEARYDLRIGIEHAGVAYEDMRRTWLLGGQVTDRVISLRGTARLTDAGQGTVLEARHFATAVRDTVPAVTLDQLETPGIPATRGVRPGSGFFSSLVEPIVMIGSIAVAIYLLFTVRS